MNNRDVELAASLRYLEGLDRADEWREMEDARKKNKQAVVVDIKKCPKGILEASHWKENGVCRCPSVEVSHVSKIMEGAYAALELLTHEDLCELEEMYRMKMHLHPDRESTDKHTAIFVFVVKAREARERR